LSSLDIAFDFRTFVLNGSVLKILSKIDVFISSILPPINSIALHRISPIVFNSSGALVEELDGDDDEEDDDDEAHNKDELLLLILVCRFSLD
jgi:hypothetical protein